MNDNVIKSRLIILFAKIDPPAVASQFVWLENSLSLKHADLSNLLLKLKEDIVNMCPLAAVRSGEQRTIFVFLGQFA